MKEIVLQAITGHWKDVKIIFFSYQYSIQNGIVHRSSCDGPWTKCCYRHTCRAIWGYYIYLIEMTNYLHNLRFKVLYSGPLNRLQLWTICTSFGHIWFPVTGSQDMADQHASPWPQVGVQGWVHGELVREASITRQPPALVVPAPASTHIQPVPPLLETYSSPCRMSKVKLTCVNPDCNKRQLTASELYRNVRRLLDFDYYFTMATKQLECHRRCVTWMDTILDQLSPGQRAQFPALLTYR